MAAEALVPSSADEAVELFGDGEGVTVFAGGTIVMPEIAAGRLKPERALLLHRTGLDELRTDGDVIRIGDTARAAGSKTLATMIVLVDRGSVQRRRTRVLAGALVVTLAAAAALLACLVSPWCPIDAPLGEAPGNRL